jgi:fucose permease
MKRNYYHVLLVFISFFVMSLLANILGPLIPDIAKSFGLSLTMVALLPFASFFAYAFMSIPAGQLMEAYGEKPVMLAAFAIGLAGSLWLALVPSYAVAIASLFIIGIGMTMLQVAINPLLRTAGGEEHFAFNSVVAQLVFGSASFLSPLLYSYLVLNLATGERGNVLLSTLSRLVPDGLAWISLYWVFCAILVAMIGVVLLSRFPRVELKLDEKIGGLDTFRHLLKKRIVWLYSIAIFAYVGAEQGTANWISKFLEIYHGYDPQTVGAQAVSLFWGLMVLGCVLGMILLKLFDSRHVVIWFSVAAMVSLTAACFGPGPVARFAFPMVGFFCSVMWSIVISLALNSLTEHHGSFSGILCTAVLGGAVVPLVIGAVGDFAGLRTGMMLLYVTFGYVLGMGFWARPLIGNKTISCGRQKRNAA